MTISSRSRASSMLNDKENAKTKRDLTRSNGKEPQDFLISSSSRSSFPSLIESSLEISLNVDESRDDSFTEIQETISNIWIDNGDQEGESPYKVEGCPQCLCLGRYPSGRLPLVPLQEHRSFNLHEGKEIVQDEIECMNSGVDQVKRESTISWISRSLCAVPSVEDTLRLLHDEDNEDHREDNRVDDEYETSPISMIGNKSLSEDHYSRISFPSFSSQCSQVDSSDNSDCESHHKHSETLKTQPDGKVPGCISITNDDDEDTPAQGLKVTKEIGSLNLCMASIKDKGVELSLDNGLVHTNGLWCSSWNDWYSDDRSVSQNAEDNCNEILRNRAINLTARRVRINSLRMNLTPFDLDDDDMAVGSINVERYTPGGLNKRTRSFSEAKLSFSQKRSPLKMRNSRQPFEWKTVPTCGEVGSNKAHCNASTSFELAGATSSSDQSFYYDSDLGEYLTNQETCRRRWSSLDETEFCDMGGVSNSCCYVEIQWDQNSHVKGNVFIIIYSTGE